MFNVFKKKKTKESFTPSLPLTWWIDDLTHSVCGLVGDPERGLYAMPWPDCEKVYVAIDKTAYDELKSQLANEIANREAVDSLCANYKAQLAERNEWLREARPWIKWAMNNHHGDMGQANQWYEKTKDLK